MWSDCFGEVEVVPGFCFSFLMIVRGVSHHRGLRDKGIRDESNTGMRRDKWYERCSCHICLRFTCHPSFS
jgi:hypothetical protein